MRQGTFDERHARPLLYRPADDPRQHARERRPPLDVSCWICHHAAVLDVDSYADDVPVPWFGPRMVCTRCGIVGADARPNWIDRPKRETLVGSGWRQA